MSRTAAVSLLATLLALAGCAGNETKPSPTTAAAAPSAATPTAPAAPTEEGGRIEGVRLSPEVIEIAKTEGKVDVEKDKRVNCEKYKPIGSNRVQFRCQTVAEQEKTREAAARDMRKIVTAPAPAETAIR